MEQRELETGTTPRTWSGPADCEVLRQLRPGGEVLAVHDRARDRLGAAWLLPRELFAENAAELSAALVEVEHAAIIQHLGLTCVEGQLALLTEPLPPRTLRDHLDENGPLPESAAIQIALRLAEALAVLHRRNLVHGAVSTEAVHVEGPEVWLADFRCAHLQGDPQQDLVGLAGMLEAALGGALSARLVELTARCRGTPEPFADAEAVCAALLAAADALAPGDTWPSIPPQCRPAPQTPELEREGDSVGSYVLQKLLGEGSMGRVFAAQHVRLGRQVALKILRPEHAQSRDIVQRFFQEARTVNEIDHEHIVEVFDFVEEAQPDGRLRAYCVMELLEGQSLTALVGGGPLPLARACLIARQLCRALGAAHRVGVVHRDVKPDNIFVIQRGGDFVKVVDFGIAKLQRPMGELPTGTTIDGAIIGTPSYMSPEQASGLPVDHRADLHALGMVLFEMLTGELPFQATRFGALAAQIISQAAPALPARNAAGEAIPVELSRLCAQLLAKDPRARPASAERVERALERIEAMPGPHRSRRGLALGVSALGIAALAGGLALRPRAREAPVVRTPAPVPQVSPAPQRQKAPMPQPVELSFTTEPSGARVFRTDTGEALGQTPLQREFPRGQGELQVRIELAGYQPVERAVTLARDVALELTLAPEPHRPRDPHPSPAPVEPARRRILDPFAQ